MFFFTQMMMKEVYWSHHLLHLSNNFCTQASQIFFPLKKYITEIASFRWSISSQHQVGAIPAGQTEIESWVTYSPPVLLLAELLPVFSRVKSDFTHQQETSEFCFFSWVCESTNIVAELSLNLQFTVTTSRSKWAGHSHQTKPSARVRALTSTAGLWVKI